MALLSNLMKSSGTWIIVILVVIFAIWALMSYSDKKKGGKDSFQQNGPVASGSPLLTGSSSISQAAPIMPTAVAPSSTTKSS
jgi:hypothetical protein